MTTLVELCAGSAAVSLRWLHPRAKPPIAYQGGKRAYADAILLAMGLRPGGGQRDGRVVLVEAGPWGEAWAHWAAGGISDTVDRLRAWAGEDPRALWTRLKDAPVPTERGERVATWAVLQFWNFGRKPVAIAGGAFGNVSFDRSRPYAQQYQAEYIAGGGDPDRYAMQDETLPSLVEALTATWRTAGFDTSAGEGCQWGDGRREATPLATAADVLDVLDVLDVRLCDAREVAPIPGAKVYFDPPYEGTTGYGHALGRADVIAIAERWRDAGCEVTISEAEPLPIPGWHHYELGKPVGNRRTFSKQKREWLTMSQRPVGVLDFGTA